MSQTQLVPQEKKIKIDGEKTRDGLAQLVLTIVELIRDLTEKQAIRRIKNGTLTEEEIERLGVNFQRMEEEVQKLKKYFGFKDEDLNLDLGPLGRLRSDSGECEKTKEVTLVDILDRLLSKGVIALGDLRISVADVELIMIKLGLLITPIDKVQDEI